MKNKILVISAIFFIAFAGFAAAQEEGEIGYSIDGYLQNLYPVGTYSDFVSTGLGGGVQTNLEMPQLAGFIPFLGVDYSYGFPAADHIDRIQDIGFTAGTGYALELSPKFTLVPELGYGVLLHVAEGKIDGEPDTRSLYLDQMVKASLKGLYALNARLELYVAPTYTLFLGSDDVGMEVGGQLGLRFKL
jgi:hypothetical protein